MHHEHDEVSPLHMSPDEAAHDRIPSWERHPTPELPMHHQRPLSWQNPLTPDPPMHQTQPTDWNRPHTPNLPLGEGFYPVDTSYHGGSSNDSHILPHQPSRSFIDARRTLSPLYDPIHSNQSNFLGQPSEPQHTGAMDPFGDEMRLASDGRVDFPSADYHR